MSDLGRAPNAWTLRDIEQALEEFTSESDGMGYTELSCGLIDDLKRLNADQLRLLVVALNKAKEG